MEVWLVQLGSSLVLPHACLIVFLEMRQPQRLPAWDANALSMSSSRLGKSVTTRVALRPC